jgi:hypothetical protein
MFEADVNKKWMIRYQSLTGVKFKHKSLKGKISSEDLISEFDSKSVSCFFSRFFLTLSIDQH